MSSATTNLAVVRSVNACQCVAMQHVAICNSLAVELRAVWNLRPLSSTFSPLCHFIHKQTDSWQFDLQCKHTARSAVEVTTSDLIVMTFTWRSVRQICIVNFSADLRGKRNVRPGRSQVFLGISKLIETPIAVSTKRESYTAMRLIDSINKVGGNLIFTARRHYARGVCCDNSVSLFIAMKG